MRKVVFVAALLDVLSRGLTARQAGKANSSLSHSSAMSLSCSDGEVGHVCKPSWLGRAAASMFRLQAVAPKSFGTVEDAEACRLACAERTAETFRKAKQGTMAKFKRAKAAASDEQYADGWQEAEDDELQMEFCCAFDNGACSLHEFEAPALENGGGLMAFAKKTAPEVDENKVAWSCHVALDIDEDLSTARIATVKTIFDKPPKPSDATSA
eukprot:TRINITY_DN53975_c0_g1_i1.p1 TRINITY_DN53975_c0_g1~~TRINITY_DN53975_c0_g1_i1.p1  ORF type:complete len:212 (+),score=38.16 TRINITY_DN53975_c0_g1_i1:69-704(+)